jgi:hypothetical protein
MYRLYVVLKAKTTPITEEEVRMAEGSVELDVAAVDGHIACLQRESQMIIEAFQRQQLKNEVSCTPLFISYNGSTCLRRTLISMSGSTSY